MKSVVIKKPCKTNMQSGYKKTKNWIIEFSFDSSLNRDVLMGWNSSSNTKKQVKLSFDTLDDAKSWCMKNSFNFTIEDQSLKNVKAKNYASNFSNNRRTSWTH